MISFSGKMRAVYSQKNVDLILEYLAKLFARNIIALAYVAPLLGCFSRIICAPSIGVRVCVSHACCYFVWHTLAVCCFGVTQTECMHRLEALAPRPPYCQQSVFKSPSPIDNTVCWMKVSDLIETKSNDVFYE